MNKNQITTVVANKLQNTLSRHEIQSVIDILIETIKETLQNNEKITFKGFLTFTTQIVSAKSGVSFGKEWSTKSRYAPKVQFSKAFKEDIAKKLGEVKNV